jgi:hypothetical protein
MVYTVCYSLINCVCLVYSNVHLKHKPHFSLPDNICVCIKYVSLIILCEIWTFCIGQNIHNHLRTLNPDLATVANILQFVKWLSASIMVMWLTKAPSYIIVLLFYCLSYLTRISGKMNIFPYKWMKKDTVNADNRMDWFSMLMSLGLQQVPFTALVTCLQVVTNKEMCLMVDGLNM